MNKVEDFVALIKANDLLKRQEKIEEEKKCNKVLWVFAVVGVIAVRIAGRVPHPLDDGRQRIRGRENREVRVGIV